MQRSPFTEGFQRRIERLAEWRKCVLNARRNFLEIPSLNNAIRLHLLEMLDQHLLADPLHQTAQFSETVRLRSMAQEAEALREKRARQIKAEAELEAASFLSRRRRALSHSPSIVDFRTYFARR